MARLLKLDFSPFFFQDFFPIFQLFGCLMQGFEWFRNHSDSSQQRHNLNLHLLLLGQALDIIWTFGLWTFGLWTFGHLGFGHFPSDNLLCWPNIFSSNLTRKKKSPKPHPKEMV